MLVRSNDSTMGGYVGTVYRSRLGQLICGIRCTMISLLCIIPDKYSSIRSSLFPVLPSYATPGLFYSLHCRTREPEPLPNQNWHLLSSPPESQRTTLALLVSKCHSGDIIAYQGIFCIISSTCVQVLDSYTCGKINLQRCKDTYARYFAMESRFSPLLLPNDEEVVHQPWNGNWQSEQFEEPPYDAPSRQSLLLPLHDEYIYISLSRFEFQ